MAPVPALILSGFLGAGKTTLLNALLTSAGGRRIAVIENEVGEESVDGELLAAPPARLIELANGCLCCTVQGQLADALDQLAARREDFDLLVVEASGVADPLPVIRAFQTETPRRAFRIRALITLVDAAHAHASETTAPEWARQVRHADLLVLNKADLADEPQLTAVERRLRTLNPRAPIHRAVRASAAPAAALTAAATTARPAGADDHHTHAHDDAHGFTAIALTVDGDLDPERLEIWLAALSAAPGMEILRVKGVLALHGHERRYVIHGVRALLDGRLERPWRTSRRRSRLVVIGRDLDERVLRDGLDACRTAPAQLRP